MRYANVGDAELGADLLHALRRAATLRDRGVGNDTQFADVREVCENILVDAVGEEFVLFVRTAIREGKDGDGLVVYERCGGDRGHSLGFRFMLCRRGSVFHARPHHHEREESQNDCAQSGCDPQW